MGQPFVVLFTRGRKYQRMSCKWRTDESINIPEKSREEFKFTFALQKYTNGKVFFSQM